MRQMLKLHPESACAAVTGIDVGVARPRPHNLDLRYLVTGRLSDLRLPPVTAPARTDGLWRHTCFEAFVRAPPNAGYTELNFAPSTHWAAYRFTGYRSGMSIAGELSAPRIDIRSNGESFELQVSLALHRVSDLPTDAPWRLGLSAVIEDMSGSLSYWALVHPPGKPDFHHPGCFALELAAP